MGTTYHISAAGTAENPDPLPKLQGKIDAALAEVNRQMSTYDPESELSKFNQAPADQWFSVSKPLLEVMQDAMSISEASGGAFDVTVGPAVNIWRFGPEKERKSFPTDQEVQAARELVGYQQIQLQADPPALKKSQQDIYVDLSAIAKGYGVDVVADLLEKEGLTSYMVEIGGEVRLGDYKPNGDAWVIGIETPVENQRDVGIKVPLHDTGLATSGDYRNFHWHEGKRYSHTINPQTARPVEHSLASVSVLHDQCALADGYATALLVLGPDAGYNLAEKNHLAAYFQIRNEDGSVETKSTSNWPRALTH
ncbi:FAD:protein FMN transferase ApbE [bacterium]|nr:FAD:protein FMN transferase ApbE [bacterium]